MKREVAKNMERLADNPLSIAKDSYALAKEIIEELQAEYLGRDECSE